MPWRLMAVLALFLVASCAECDVPDEINHTISYDPLLEAAYRIIEPLADVGAGLDPAMPDEFNLYCTATGECLTAKNARDAAEFLLRY